MRNLHVPLEREELDDLVELARQQRRRPADQAALLICEALKATKAQITDSTRSATATAPLVAA